MRVLPVNSAADRVSSAQNLPHGAESGDGKRNLPRAVKLQKVGLLQETRDRTWLIVLKVMNMQ